MLKIYGADLSSPANKVRFVANYLNLEYEYNRVNIRGGEHRSEVFLKINPIGKVPAIDDDGFCLFESGAIIKYLASKHSLDLYPGSIQERALIDQWSDFSVIHIGAAMNRVVFNRLFAPIIKEEVDERSLADGLKFLDRFLPNAETQLAKNPFLAGGAISLSDFSLLAALDPAEVVKLDLSAYPALSKWRKSLQEKDFYTKCHKNYGEALERVRAMAK